MDKYVNELREKQELAKAKIGLGATATALTLKNFSGLNLAIKDKLVKSSDPYIKMALVNSNFTYGQGKGAMASKNGLGGKGMGIKYFAQSKVNKLLI